MPGSRNKADVHRHQDLPGAHRLRKSSCGSLLRPQHARGGKQSGRGASGCFFRFSWGNKFPLYVGLVGLNAD